MTGKIEDFAISCTNFDGEDIELVWDGAFDAEIPVESTQTAAFTFKAGGKPFAAVWCYPCHLTAFADGAFIGTVLTRGYGITPRDLAGLVLEMPK